MSKFSQAKLPAVAKAEHTFQLPRKSSDLAKYVASDAGFYILLEIIGRGEPTLESFDLQRMRRLLFDDIDFALASNLRKSLDALKEFYPLADQYGDKAKKIRKGIQSFFFSSISELFEHAIRQVVGHDDWDDTFQPQPEDFKYVSAFQREFDNKYGTHEHTNGFNNKPWHAEYVEERRFHASMALMVASEMAIYAPNRKAALGVLDKAIATCEGYNPSESFCIEMMGYLNAFKTHMSRPQTHCRSKEQLTRRWG